jgi:DNA primase
MPSIDYRAVRAAVPLRRVLELLQFTPVRRRGDELRGPCPIHGSHSPRSLSFAANVRKQAYCCFVCGAGGNQLDLWAAVSHLPLYAATCDLCQRLGIEIPQLPQPMTSTPRRRTMPSG